jgi:hypothetical protein
MEKNGGFYQLEASFPLASGITSQGATVKKIDRLEWFESIDNYAQHD